MPTIPERLETATALAEVDSALLHAIINGPASGAGSTVTTEGGAVPTIAKKIADVYQSVLTVANDSARFALTSTTAPAGRIVKVTSSGNVYIVVDIAYLDSEAGWAALPPAGPATVIIRYGTASEIAAFSLALAELAFATDTNALWIGTSGGNVLVTSTGGGDLALYIRITAAAANGVVDSGSAGTGGTKGAVTTNFPRVNFRAGNGGPAQASATGGAGGNGGGAGSTVYAITVRGGDGGSAGGSGNGGAGGLLNGTFQDESFGPAMIVAKGGDGGLTIGSGNGGAGGELRGGAISIEGGAGGQATGPGNGGAGGRARGIELKGGGGGAGSTSTAVAGGAGGAQGIGSPTIQINGGNGGAGGPAVGGAGGVPGRIQMNGGNGGNSTSGAGGAGGAAGTLLTNGSAAAGDTAGAAGGNITTVANGTRAGGLISTAAGADRKGGTLDLSNLDISISGGTGSPEGVKTANVGSLYLRIDSGAGTTLYVKESGTGNTGWAAK